jgi:Zn-dependent peptidase ImmA (M78 family)
MMFRPLIIVIDRISRIFLTSREYGVNTYQRRGLMSNTAKNIGAEVAAKIFLDEFWEEGRFPVDPVFIAQEVGIKVVKSDLPENVSGALIKEKGKDPVIFLDKKDSDARKRFTCAHELGHFYLRIDEESYKSIDLRDYELSSSGDNPVERFANSFAANLLMPEKEIRSRSDWSKVELIALFGVSGEALKWRLKNLGIEHEEFSLQ